MPSIEFDRSNISITDSITSPDSVSPSLPTLTEAITGISNDFATSAAIKISFE